MGTTRTNVHDHQYAEDTTYIHNDYQKDYKCANCQGNHGAGSRDCGIWKEEKEITKLKHIQNITYPEARTMVEITKYMEMTKKYIPTNKAVTCETNATTILKVVAQLVNEMRALIQKMKTVKEVVTEKLSKDPNTRVCNKPRETGKAREEKLRSPHF